MCAILLTEAKMFEEELGQFDINTELDRFYALQKRADDVIDNYTSAKISADEYANSLEEISAELDDVRQSFKDLLEGNKKREMLGKVNELKRQLNGLLISFFNFGA